MAAAAVCAAVIVVRIAWVTGVAAFSRWRCRPPAGGVAGPCAAVALSPRAAAVVGWCGMGGTVTPAPALVLPAEFPQRDLILTTAFGVTLGTLVLQGLTLRPLLMRLRLEDDGTVDREARLARVETLRAAVEAVAATTGAETTELVRRRYELQLSRAEEEAAMDGAGVMYAPPEGSANTAEPSVDTDGRGRTRRSCGPRGSPSGASWRSGTRARSATPPSSG